VCVFGFLYCASRSSSTCDDVVSRVAEQVDVASMSVWRIKFPCSLEQYMNQF